MTEIERDTALNADPCGTGATNQNTAKRCGLARESESFAQTEGDHAKRRQCHRDTLRPTVSFDRPRARRAVAHIAAAERFVVRIEDFDVKTLNRHADRVI